MPGPRVARAGVIRLRVAFSYPRGFWYRREEERPVSEIDEGRTTAVPQGGPVGADPTGADGGAAFLSDRPGRFDLDGDGVPDVETADTTGDGLVDAQFEDYDGDGVPDLEMYDTSGDGKPDFVHDVAGGVESISVDMNGDGEDDVRDTFPA
jgi:hypothetical protein